MGRWTPLVLMAGGLAILLGTLLGISFPMGGQNTAQNSTPTVRNRASRVLPANININSTGASNNTPSNNTPSNNTTSNNRSSVAQAQQDSNNSNEPVQEGTDNSTNNQSTTESNQSNEPIRALW